MGMAENYNRFQSHTLITGILVAAVIVFAVVFFIDNFNLTWLFVALGTAVVAAISWFMLQKRTEVGFMTSMVEEVSSVIPGVSESVSSVIPHAPPVQQQQQPPAQPVSEETMGGMSGSPDPLKPIEATSSATDNNVSGSY